MRVKYRLKGEKAHSPAQVSGLNLSLRGLDLAVISRLVHHVLATGAGVRQAAVTSAATTHTHTGI
jgi:hypothetical protein